MDIILACLACLQPIGQVWNTLEKGNTKNDQNLISNIVKFDPETL